MNYPMQSRSFSEAKTGLDHAFAEYEQKTTDQVLAQRREAALEQALRTMLDEVS